jgi:hypothetical protein
MNTRYAQIRSLLVPNSPNSYAQWGFLLPTWQGDAFSAFLTSYEFPSAWTAASRDAVYSAALWMMVKNWEINQEYGLEGMPSAAFGSKANARAWDSGVPFNVSPIILHITPGPGLGNGSDIVREYLGYIWYHMQLVLNDGNGHGASQNPIDWNYTQLEVMGLTASSGAPHAMLEMTWLIKSLQEMTQLGIGPDRGGSGFQPTEMSPMILVYPSYENNWSAIPPATRVSLTQACLQAYFNQVQSYSNLQYDIGVGSIGLPWASPIENPQTDDWLTVFGGEIWHMLPRMRFLGVSPSLTYSISGWASTLWPAGNWGANNGSTCNNLYTCASD